jgi:hypothetical protein
MLQAPTNPLGVVGAAEAGMVEREAEAAAIIATPNVLTVHLFAMSVFPFLEARSGPHIERLWGSREPTCRISGGSASHAFVDYECPTRPQHNQPIETRRDPHRDSLLWLWSLRIRSARTSRSVCGSESWPIRRV